ncbi:hypothetical protein [Nocardioides sp.]|uniref:hypothetical protein n=1 Tax=Nocardioides sp. TaxID=35761 RepID=UPI002C1C7261|nr:hypothetical protein [Nocardioides sp.]HSX67489.1 hypothetical protein [Nocardioides sp.]
MERADLKQILKEYDLGTVVFLDEEPSRPRAFVVQPAEDRWLVFRTGRQGETLPGTEASFEAEPEALAHVVAVLREEAAERRRSAEAAAQQRSRRRLPPAKPALKKLRATLAEIRHFLQANGLGSELGRIGSLAALAAREDESATDVMLAAARLHTGMRRVPRDGWRDLYVPTASGAVDRKATARLEQLKQQLARQLDPWT